MHPRQQLARGVLARGRQPGQLLARDEHRRRDERVAVADETIHHILKGDLVLNRDEGLLKLDNGDTLQVLFPRGLQLRVSFEESPSIMLGACCEGLEFYLARANPQFPYDPTGYHSGEERTE